MKDRFTQSQIIDIIKEQESGIATPVLCRNHGIGQSTFYRCKSHYGGMSLSEAIDLRWEQVDLERAELHVTRLKNGKPATHPLDSITMRALGRLKKNSPPTPYLFVTDQSLPLSARTAHHIIAQAGKAADFPFTIHPHMLRHSTGFYLANKGIDTRAIQAYMGHSNINNTVIYTAMDANRFNNFWK